MVFTSEKRLYPIFIDSPDFKGEDTEDLDSVDFGQAKWRKSSWSAFNGNCVEVAGFRDSKFVGVRDTNDAGCGPTLIFGSEAWSVFLDAIKSGDQPS
jgi:hypothetical protein